MMQPGTLRQTANTPPGERAYQQPTALASPPSPPQAAAAPSSSLLKSGAVMALGTIASRVTGFLRTAVLAAALSTGALADGYNTANTVPNIIYDLLLGGILTSIVVPLIVRARDRDRRYGEEYEQRLFTVAVIFLAGLTALAVLLAPVLIDIWGHGYQGAQRDLAIEFARFFLPQIFFYGVGAFAGAILNTRNHFAAPMWAPVLNNLVVIAVGGVFLSITTGTISPGSISAGQRLLLEVGTTGGIVLQTIALWPSLRSAGFRWRPRLNFQQGELGAIGRTAVWTLVYVIATQVGFAVTTALLNSTGVQGRAEHVGDVGFTPYSYAYQLLQLPYAIVGVSVITALMPRMSGHAAEGRRDLVRDDFSNGLRLSSVIIVPGAVLMLTLAQEISLVLFAHGHTSQAGAQVIAGILAMFAIALVPFSIYQLLLRVFYAYRDTRTPAVVAIGTAGTNVVLALVMYRILPTAHVAMGIAFGFALTNIVGLLACWVVLRYRLGGLDGRRVITTHVKLLGAAVPVGVYAFCIHFGFDRLVGPGQLSALATLVIGAGGGGIIYLVAAQFLRVGEVETMVRTLSSRFRPSS